MKITVTSNVQHDMVTYTQGRHTVSDAIGKALIASGAARDGWTDDEGPLSEAGTQSPPGQSGGDEGDAGDDTAGRTSAGRTSAAGKTATGSAKG